MPLEVDTLDHSHTLVEAGMDQLCTRCEVNQAFFLCTECPFGLCAECKGEVDKVK